MNEKRKHKNDGTSSQQLPRVLASAHEIKRQILLRRASAAAKAAKEVKEVNHTSSHTSPPPPSSSSRKRPPFLFGSHHSNSNSNGVSLEKSKQCHFNFKRKRTTSSTTTIPELNSLEESNYHTAFDFGNGNTRIDSNNHDYGGDGSIPILDAHTNSKNYHEAEQSSNPQVSSSTSASTSAFSRLSSFQRMKQQQQHQSTTASSCSPFTSILQTSSNHVPSNGHSSKSSHNSIQLVNMKVQKVPPSSSIWDHCTKQNQKNQRRRKQATTTKEESLFGKIMKRTQLEQPSMNHSSKEICEGDTNSNNISELMTSSTGVSRRSLFDTIGKGNNDSSSNMDDILTKTIQLPSSSSSPPPVETSSTYRTNVPQTPPPRKKQKQWDSKKNIIDNTTYNNPPHYDYGTPIKPATTETTATKTTTRNYNSPGGFSLQRLLDTCQAPQVAYNKKFLRNSNKKKKKSTTTIDTTNVDEDDENNSINNADGIDVGENQDDNHNNEEDYDDWHEGTIRIPKNIAHYNDKFDKETNKETKCQNRSDYRRGEVSIVDWSIKKMLKFECHPGGCLPGRPFITSHKSSNIVASRNYISGSNSKDNSKERKEVNFLKLHHDPGRIDKLAMTLFMNNQLMVTDLGNNYNRGKSNKHEKSIRKQEEEVLSQWQAGLMYFQHPSIHPLPQNMLSNNLNKGPVRSSSSSSSSTRRLSTSIMLPSSGSNMSSKSFRRLSSEPSSRSKLFSDSKSRTSNRKLSDSVYGSKARLQQRSSMAGLGCLGGLGECYNNDGKGSSVASLLDQRDYEWQECFRSLFQMWMGQIDDINCDISDNENDGDGNGIGSIDKTHIEDLIFRTYFYSIAPGTTILFKASSFVKCVDGKVVDRVRPIIIISSSTFEMRCALRAMGIHMIVLESKGRGADSQHYNVDEKFIDEWFKEKVIESDIDDSLQKELEELRRATTNAESIGGDISFSLGQKNASKTLKRKKSSDFPPLLIRDHDNCMAFFEFYLNTCGCKYSKMPLRKKTNKRTNVENIQDVPLLLSRSLSATKYMNIRQLTVLCNRDIPEKSNNDMNSLQKDGSGHSLVDIRGPILPCAVRDLLCATTSHLSLHQKQSIPIREGAEDAQKFKTKDKDNEDQCFEDDQNTLGSHYYVLHLQAHQGEKSDGLASELNRKRIGAASSELFNGLDNGKKSEKMSNLNDDLKIRECNTGEIMNMVVWDISRPNSIAFNTGESEESHG